MPDRIATPASLHLARLAQATPDAPLELPESGGRLSSLHLTHKHSLEPIEAWYVVLSGELLIDLPHGQFVHLRAGETYRAPAGLARTLSPVREASVLIVRG